MNEQKHSLIAYLATLGAIVALAIAAALVCLLAPLSNETQIAKLLAALGAWLGWKVLPRGVHWIKSAVAAFDFCNGGTFIYRDSDFAEYSIRGKLCSGYIFFCHIGHK